LALVMSGSSLAIDISKVCGDQQLSQTDRIAVEEPLEIQLCSTTGDGAAAKSISITMRTPGDDAELAVGFLYTESIIQGPSQLVSVDHIGETDADTGLRNRIRVELTPEVEIDFGSLERHFYTTSSCGVCGKASLDALHVTGLKTLQDNRAEFRREVIVAMPERLMAGQHLFGETGGLHAAALFDEAGDIIVVREDVGRHNAVDKVIGWMFMNGRLPAQRQGLMVSGRASFELMQKSLVAGIPLLAAVGAPSSLAVQMAKDFGMTLVGFLRDDRFNIYSDTARII
jgi:FdhD protein